jgi:hypothetical protein
MHSEAYNAKQAIIETKTSGLSSGIYFISLKNDNINRFFKLIKE